MEDGQSVILVKIAVSYHHVKNTYHKTTEEIIYKGGDITIYKQIFSIRDQYQVISDNINSFKSTTEEEMKTIASLLGISLSTDEIKKYIKSHEFHNLEEGSKIDISYRLL